MCFYLKRENDKNVQYMSIHSVASYRFCVRSNLPLNESNNLKFSLEF